jgi:hypothetical protein
MFQSSTEQDIKENFNNSFVNDEVEIIRNENLIKAYYNYIISLSLINFNLYNQKINYHS